MPTGNLPAEGKALWEKVYDKALAGSCKDSDDPEACAAASAWKAVKNAGWRKVDGKWQHKATVEFSLTVKRAAYDKATNEMRWRADTSSTNEDSYGDVMTLELYNDFISRIESNSPAPDRYRSDFWQGGMPYLSVSHYPDLDGRGVPGSVDQVYIDGDYLKAKGKFDDTPMGRACFRALCDDLYGEKSEYEDKVRVSIAFLDWMHRHRSNGFVYERKKLDDICPECIRELFMGEEKGLEYLRGQLVHLALTRVPVNTDTLMEVDKSMTTRKEDAASIVGNELADELEEEAKLVGKSAAMVVKSEEEEELEPEAEPIVEEAKHEDEMDEDEEDEDEKEEEDTKKKSMEWKAKLSINDVHAELLEIRSMLRPATPPVHPLDDAIEALRADYDSVAESDMTANDKLQFLQTAYANLGTAIKSHIEEPAPIEEPIDEVGNGDMVKAFSQAMAPLLQAVNLLSTKLDGFPSPNDPGIPPPPQPRRIQPTLSAQLPQKSMLRKPAQSNSATPNLREQLRKTVW